jgi:L-ribulose-5-phosphate 3-epimerase UlaE
VADESLWAGFRAIVQGYRNVTALVESSLNLINTYKPSPGTAVQFTSGLDAADFDELAIKLSSSGVTSSYLLEVWTKRSAG